MRIFADTASLAEIEELNDHPWIAGFTTNPSLFLATGVTNPEQHAKEIVRLTDKPVSIDGPPEKVWGLGPNAIPKTVVPLVHVAPINFTVVMRPADVERLDLLPNDIVSVFAGRIMDTGRSPKAAIDAARVTGAQVLWASTREPYNYVQAYKYGCDIITMTPPIFKKYVAWKAKPLDEVQAETLAQFEADRLSW